MDAHTHEIAAATLEHAERIRLLTDRMEKQRRSIAKLSYAVGVLLALQVLALLPVAMGNRNAPFVAPEIARGFLIGLACVSLGLLLRGRAREARIPSS